MKIGGKLNKWNVILDKFTMGTPVGDIEIITEGCSEMLLDMLITAMKERKTIYIEVDE